MGKILDDLIKTAHPIEAYREMDAKNQTTLSSYTSPQKTFSLPKPYNKSNGVKEAPIQKAILQALQSMGITAWRIEGGGKLAHTANGMTVLPSSMKGMPDIIGITPTGHFFGIEVKQYGGKLSGAQYTQLQKIKTNGGFAAVGVSTEIVKVLMEWYQEGLDYPNNKIGVFVA